MRNFTTLRSNVRTNPTQQGRRRDESKIKSFEKVCMWLEDADDLYTVSEVHDKLQELAGHGIEVYGKKIIAR